MLVVRVAMVIADVGAVRDVVAPAGQLRHELPHDLLLTDPSCILRHGTQFLCVVVAEREDDVHRLLPVGIGDALPELRLLLRRVVEEHHVGEQHLATLLLVLAVAERTGEALDV